MASATRIALAGLDLIRTRPRAVLAWGFVYLVFAIVTSLLTRPMVDRMLLTMPRPGTVAAAGFSPGWDVLGPIAVANIGLLGMMLVLLAAAMRAVLRPQEQGAFFIRVGLDELRLLGTIVLLGLIITGIYVLTTVAIAFLAVIVGFAAGTTGAGQAGTALVVILLILANFALLIALQTRFALALPLTLLRGRIVVREAWRRSRGHFWPLFGGFLLNGLIVAGVSLLMSLPALLTYFADGGVAAVLSDPRRQVEAMRSPLLYPMWLLMPLLGGFLIAMLGGALGMGVIETERTAG